MSHTQDRDTLVARLSALDTSALPEDGGPDFNRLIFEKSPYLLQHAANPVDWYPWGEKAFAAAVADNKPVLVSIGYSTCHWCHVMEQESFEDSEVAAMLKRHFIAIKVDREERPDIDNTYMTVCQLLTGGGGWPLNVFLAPDKTPFFAATYLPRNARGETSGIIEVLERIGAMWTSDPERLLQTGRELRDMLLKLEAPTTTGGSSGALEDFPLQGAYETYLDNFDDKRGGFSEAPKFPTPHNLSLLLRIHARYGLDNARTMALRTLQHIRLGGIYDHVGFGVHRYSVDAFWRVPHFEKMLYDQALLATAALDAFQSSGDGFFSNTADEILRYVIRDLTHECGAFCCGEDADSEGEEGTFYLWTPEQVEEVLGHEHGTIFCHCYEISPEGNFEGKNIPRLEMDLTEWAKWFGVPAQELGAVLALGLQKLQEARRQRVRPYRDDKVLTAWNGLMIAAMARGGAVLGYDEFTQAASRAADFILSTMRDASGRLLRRYRDGEAAIPGFLEDYAFFIQGLLELYQATFDQRYLGEALCLAKAMQALFDSGNGVFFDTGTDAEEVLGRKRTLIDAAVPAGNSVAALVLLQLAVMTGDGALEEAGEAILKASAQQMDKYPTGSAQLLIALDFALGPRQVLVLAGDPATPRAKAMLQPLRQRFLPRTLVLWRRPEDTALDELAPVVRGKLPLDDGVTAFLCREQTCLEPARSPEELAALLDEPEV